MGVKAWAAKSAKGKLEPFEFEQGPLGNEDVEVRVTHCGICHSDVAMIDNDWAWSQYPLVPGHEAIGVITAIGRDVTALKVGQRVGVGWQSGSCNICQWCMAGREDLCLTEKDTIVGRPGGWAESVRSHWKFAFPIPDAIPSEYAGPLMCAGTTVFAPLLHNNVTAGMRTAVVGIGGLGHLAVQYLAAFGCEVTAISSTHNKDDEAKKLGASRFIATRDSDELSKAANSFDFILATASGAGIEWTPYVNALRPGGRLVIPGSIEGEIKVPLVSLIGKEKAIGGGRSGSPTDTRKMLEFTARHKIRPIIEPFAMKDVNAAIAHLVSGKARYRVVLTA